jgi:hypothetical protein
MISIQMKNNSYNCIKTLERRHFQKQGSCGHILGRDILMQSLFRYGITENEHNRFGGSEEVEVFFNVQFSDRCFFCCTSTTKIRLSKLQSFEIRKKVPIIAKN